MLVVLAISIVGRIWLPGEGVLHVPWLLPSVAGILFVLLTSAPSILGARRRVQRLALILPGILVLAVALGDGPSRRGLDQRQGVANSPDELRAAGAIVWLGNNLAFGLLYSLIDGGGPVARWKQHVPVDFAFTQQVSPELAPGGWSPVFLDYFHLGFTNATAFSPTDVLPLSHRAKYTMLVQSTVFLALFGLVVAWAVNVFK